MATRAERAHHEAGHAVAIHHLGDRVDRISIDAVGPLAGYVFSSPAGAPEWTPDEIDAHAAGVGAVVSATRAPAEPTAREIEQGVLVALAGPEAQRRYAGQRHSPVGDDFDMRKARQLLGADRRSAWDVCADLADARERTREFLDAHWSEVEAVAYSLECVGTITGAQFRTLIGALTAPAARAPASAPEPARVVWHRERAQTRVLALSRLRPIGPLCSPALRVFA